MYFSQVWSGSKMLYLVCKMLFKVNYFVVDNGKNVICGVFIKAEMILFCMCAEFHVNLFSNDF